MNTAKETALQLQDPGYWEVLSVVLLPALIPVVCFLVCAYLLWIAIGLYLYKRELKVQFGNEECGE